MTRMIDVYNKEVDNFLSIHQAKDKKQREAAAADSVNRDTTRISWAPNLMQDLVKGEKFTFHKSKVCPSLYRPFIKLWLYNEKHFVWSRYQMMRIFPNVDTENVVIMVKQRWSGDGQFALMINTIVDLQSDGGNQCFPLYLYDVPEQSDADSPQSGLFDKSSTKSARKRRDAITDAGLGHFQSAYSGDMISKEDLFYYIYGLLHSTDYSERYADNLAKELPRIPRVKTATDFRAFSKAGRALAELHLNYETVSMYAGAKVDTGGKKLADTDYRVEKMKVPKSGKDKDLTTLIYNRKITVTGIPPEAYDYVVNGKPALDWVIERQCVKTDKDSGIVNDANDWATETMHNPRYPLELFLRVITVSLETMKIVRSLPKLEIRADG
jgi:predicted helicase